MTKNKIIFNFANILSKIILAEQKEKLAIKKFLNSFLNKEIVYEYVEIERYR